jgi:hypothetical protein
MDFLKCQTSAASPAEPGELPCWFSRRWMFVRIFGLDGRESYRELRLEPLCCPHRISRGTAPHERQYPRRKDRF